MAVLLPDLLFEVIEVARGGAEDRQVEVDHQGRVSSRSDVPFGPLDVSDDDVNYRGSDAELCELLAGEVRAPSLAIAALGIVDGIVEPQGKLHLLWTLREAAEPVQPCQACVHVRERVVMTLGLAVPIYELLEGCRA